MDLLILPLLFGVVYFVMIRPQQKRQQEMVKMLSGLAVDDDVITIGGIYGTVVALDDDHLDLQVTADGTVLRFRRDAIARVVGVDDDGADFDELEGDDVAADAEEPLA